MSMDIPPVQREFILEPKSSNSDDIGVRLRNLVPVSINSFLHGDKKELAMKLDSAATITFGVLLSGDSLLAWIDSMKPQDSNDGNSLLSSPLVFGLNIALIAAIYAMRETSTRLFLNAYSNEDNIDTAVIEKTELPTNNAKLREDVYNAALQSGIMPNQFIDHVLTHDTIEIPVAFTDDPTSTIYDLEAVKNLQEHNIMQNPMAPNLRLDFSKLVYLPEVKKQIDEISNLQGKED
jgi:hypothetical protein